MGCCYCQKIISSPFDLHEIIVSRGDARGREDVQLLIMSQFNCGLVHQGNCHPLAEGFEGTQIGIRYLVKWEGYDPIIKWLESLRPFFKGNLVDNKIRLVEMANGRR